MLDRRRCVLPAIVMLAACAQAPPERQIVDEAEQAMGGLERLQAVQTLTSEGEGRQWNLGQDLTPGARGQTFDVTVKRAIDLPTGRVRTELTRTPQFPYFQGQAPQRQVQGLDGEVGYNVLPNGNAVRVSPQVAAERRADSYHHPVTLLMAALEPGATLARARTEGAERLVDITTADGLTLVLAVNAEGLPSRIESRSAHANLGDVTLATRFTDYQEVAGLELPGRVTSNVDDFTIAEIRYATHTVNGDVGDLAAPEGVASAAAPAGPPPVRVAAEEVAPGIWLLAGQSHHSLLVELSDHLMLVEAPQSEARTLGVIATARELRPDKPLTKIVASHHHFDHTAGIRAAIAEGLTVVSHSGNRAFFEEMARRPHTISPDALARAPKPLAIETVDDALVIEDAARTVAIYHIAGNPHSETMLMVHFPQERLLVEVDAYSPGAQANPYAANLLENIRTRKLQVDRIVPLHGAIVPFGQLEQDVAATQS